MANLEHLFPSMIHAVRVNGFVCKDPKDVKADDFEGPKPATRGGEWEPIKISFEIQIVGLYPENHPSPQAF